MKASPTSYQLSWPRSLDERAIAAFFRALAGKAAVGPVVLDALGVSGQLQHYLTLPAARADVTLRRLSLAAPGIRATKVEPALITVSRALRLKLSSRRRALRADLPADAALAILSVLGGTRRGEVLQLQWVLGPRLRAVAIPNHFIDFNHNAPWQGLLKAPFVAPSQIDPEQRTALRTKQSLAGWRVTGRIAAKAAAPERERQLLHELLAALRVAEAPGLKLVGHPEPVKRIQGRRAPLLWPSVINEVEIVGLSGWPLGDTQIPGLSRSAFALLPASTAVPRTGRVVADSTYPGDERPLALNAHDALRHTYLLGPTGVGKSTLLGQLCLADARDGRAVVLIDSKGDLVDDVLARLPANRLDDVVVIDPGDSAYAVGLNPLHSRPAEASLVVDRLVSIFRQLYGDNLGPRSEDILHASLLTLAYAGNQTITALPLLLTNPGFRRRIVSQLDDPLGVGSFWQWYDNVSEAERRQAIAPLMNKLRAFLLRPTMRRMLGQAEPRFSVRQVFTERKLLLVSLPKGQLGPETAQLFGALLLNEVWQHTLSRSRIAAERRHPVMVYVDEFQDYLRLPTPLPDVFAAARGLGVGLTVANQHLDQLTPDVRAAVLGNAGSRVVFRLNEVDAPQLARDSQVVTSEDFRGLGAYEAYVSLMAHGERTGYASARTRPFGPAVRSPAEVRRASAKRWGRSAAEVDAELRALVTEPMVAPGGPVGRRPRTGGLS